MKKQPLMSEEEVNELRKSLGTLGLGEDEINGYIEKAMGNKTEESSSEGTIEDKANKGEGEGTEEENKDIKDKKKVRKEMSPEDIEKCAMLKSEKARIEKAIKDLEGDETDEGESKEEKKDEVKKSLLADINKSFGERFYDIEKSLTEKFGGEIESLQEIVKSIKEDVKKIGDTPFPFKSVINKANFFEKGTGSDFGDSPEKELSITRDRDEILKGLQDAFDSSKDDDVRAMLMDGITDFTVNPTPTTHGIRAIAHLSRTKNITIAQ